MRINKIFYALSIYLIGNILLRMFLNIFIDNENILIYSIGLLICQILILIPIYLINKDDITSMFKDFKINYQKYLKLAFVFWIFGFLIMLSLNYLINYLILDEAMLSTNEEAVRDFLFKYPLYSIIAIPLLVPIIEELVFRLSFNGIKNKYLFILLTSSLFAFLHILADLNSPLALYFFPYLTIGLVFSLSYYKTKNIFSGIIIHIWHNTLTLILIFLF